MTGRSPPRGAPGRTQPPPFPRGRQPRCTTRSATAAASSGSWVTCTAVVPRSLQQLAAARRPGGRAGRGRGRRAARRGAAAGARARASGPARPAGPRRRRGRPPSAARSRAGRPARAGRATRPAIAGRGTPLHAQPEGHVLAHVAVGEQLVVLEHEPEAPPVGRHGGEVLAVPARRGRRRARASPATTRSSVVLPPPLGPCTATISPSATARSTPSSTARSSKRTTTPSTTSIRTCPPGRPGSARRPGSRPRSRP